MEYSDLVDQVGNLHSRIRAAFPNDVVHTQVHVGSMAVELVDAPEAEPKTVTLTCWNTQTPTRFTKISAMSKSSEDLTLISGTYIDFADRETLTSGFVACESPNEVIRLAREAWGDDWSCYGVVLLIASDTGRQFTIVAREKAWGEKWSRPGAEPPK
jgi:hypothetical protein